MYHSSEVIFVPVEIQGSILAC